MMVPPSARSPLLGRETMMKVRVPPVSTSEPVRVMANRPVSSGAHGLTKGHRKRVRLEFIRPDIASSGAITIAIHGPSHATLIGSLTGVAAAAWCGGVAGVDGRAVGQQGMGESAASIVLEGTEFGVNGYVHCTYAVPCGYRKVAITYVTNQVMPQRCERARAVRPAVMGVTGNNGVPNLNCPREYGYASAF